MKPSAWPPKAIVSYNARSNGLGNRLRATLGARNLAEATGRHLFVVWPTGPAFRPRFSDLWLGRLGTPMPLPVSQGLAKVFAYRDEHLTAIRADDSSPVWQIRTGSVLELPEGVRNWEEDLRELRPIPVIAERVRRLHAQFGAEPYVGVQVRSHAVSHDKTRVASPVEWFRDRLDSLTRSNPELRLFLSCDSPDVQKEFLARYPQAVAITDKGGYNTVAGVQSAVVDTYLLASAGYVIGPAHSSFVELAIRLASHRVPFENSLKQDSLRVTDLTTVVDPLRPAVRISRA